MSPDRGVVALDALAADAGTAAARAEVTGITAETLADAGRFAEALARLGASGHDDVVAPHRDAVLARWIARLASDHDDAGVVAVYAMHRTTLDASAGAATLTRVAEALRRTGLPHAALRVLRLHDPGDDPAMTLAVADAALAADAPGVARDVLARFDDVPAPVDLEPLRMLLVARLAVADGRLEDAVAGAGPNLDPAFTDALVAAWIARGDAAAGREAWDDAADGYARAAALAADRVQRARAIAGLVTARATTMRPVDAPVADLAGLGDAVLDRGAALLGATRTFGTTVAAPTDEGADRR